MGFPKKFALPKELLRDLIPQMGGSFATDKIMVEGKKIGYFYREPNPKQG
jgi:hypothetical protein